MRKKLAQWWRAGETLDLKIRMGGRSLPEGIETIRGFCVFEEVLRNQVLAGIRVTQTCWLPVARQDPTWPLEQGGVNESNTFRLKSQWQVLRRGRNIISLRADSATRRNIIKAGYYGRYYADWA